MNARWIALSVLGGTLAALGGCGGGGGNSASAPTNLVATVGDGRITLSYTAKSGVDYWAFVASFSNLTRDNAEQILTDIDQPEDICGLYNNKQYWLALNGRTNGGAGGSLSNVVTATPRPAGSTWSVSGAPGSGTVNSLGYTYTDYCRSFDYDLTTLPGKGFLVAVGDNGLLQVSSDYGSTWTAGTLPSGFTANLYAAGGYTENPSSSALSDKNVRLVAVGAEGVILRSEDGVAWTQTRAGASGQPDLTAVTRSGTTLVVAGKSGTILSSTDAKTWSARSSGTTADLHGLASGGGIYVAVGDNGTLLTASSSSTWTTETSGTTAALRSVAYGNYAYTDGVSDTTIDTYVVVGDSGTVLTSTNGGSTWQTVTPFTASNLVAVGYSTRFVALDAAGNSWTSENGLSWSGPYATGLASGLTMVSTGSRYFATDASNLAMSR